MSFQKATDQAEHRYLTDPTFHANVDIIVRLIEAERGVHLDDADRSLATLAVATTMIYHEGPQPREMTPSQAEAFERYWLNRPHDPAERERMRRMILGDDQT